MPNSTNYRKADNFNRLLAVAIDSMIAGILSFIPLVSIGWILAGLYMLFRDGTGFGFMEHRSFGKQIMKLKVINLENPDKPVGLKLSSLRNWIFLLPIILRIIPGIYFVPRIGQIFFVIINAAIPVALLVFLVEGINVLKNPEGQRLGDRWANTLVVEE